MPVSESDVQRFKDAVRDQFVDEVRVAARNDSTNAAAVEVAGRRPADRLGTGFRDRRGGSSSRSGNSRLGGDWRGQLGSRLKELDKNNNGEIEENEIDERSRRYIRFIDTNKDGKVSKEELSRLNGR